jgi:hypothetical protein
MQTIIGVIIGIVVAIVGYFLLTKLDKRALDRDLFVAQCEAAAKRLGFWNQWDAIQEEIQDPSSPESAYNKLTRNDWTFGTLSYSQYLVIPYSLIHLSPDYLQHRLRRVAREVAQHFPWDWQTHPKYVVNTQDRNSPHRFVKDPAEYKTGA